MTYLMIIGGLVLLFVGGEGLVRGSVSVARKLNVSELVIGLTLVGFGTSVPELVTSLRAIEQGAVGISVGNVVGSNIANVMLVLGTASILGAASDPGQGIRRDAMAVAAATVILLAAVLIGEVAWQLGILMLLGLVFYYSYSYRASKAEGTDVEDSDTWLPDRIALAVPVTAAGGYMIWIGAEMLVQGATGLAGSYGISESVIGLSVVALGTSLPELAVTLVAGLRGQGGVAVGNVLGSNVMNIMGILGVAATYSGGLVIAPEFASRDIWVVVVTSGFVVAMLLDERHIGRRVGAAMVGGYLAYMAMLYL